MRQSRTELRQALEEKGVLYLNTPVDVDRSEIQAINDPNDRYWVIGNIDEEGCEAICRIYMHLIKHTNKFDNLPVN